MSDTEKLAAERANVLIADDVQSIRLILKSMLREMGFVNITEAANGKLALKAIDNNKFNLILCDWEMPESNGNEILAIVRHSPLNKNSVFIMCTGNAQEDIVKDAISNGVSDFITKPFNQNTLEEKVSMHFLVN
jgi:two-component system chemotaxis response regulator CheY